MAEEADVRVSLTIRKGYINYQSAPDQFFADVSVGNEPVPGVVTVTTDGVDVDLSTITEPGLCRMVNFGPTNYIEWGIWDPQTLIFYPIGEILPGETYVVRLSRNLMEQYGGTGTGTTGPENRLRMKANVATCVAIVEVFEK